MAIFSFIRHVDATCRWVPKCFGSTQCNSIRQPKSNSPFYFAHPGEMLLKLASIFKSELSYLHRSRWRTSTRRTLIYTITALTRAIVVAKAYAKERFTFS